MNSNQILVYKSQIPQLSHLKNNNIKNLFSSIQNQQQLMKKIQSESEQGEFFIQLPNPSTELGYIFNQLKLFSKERLDNTEPNGQGMENGDQIKGLKFISAKLAKLFFKNRKLPYNEISKILIDNFASQQKDERNIKRRVYDAINVLVAAGVLIKKNNFIEMIKNKIKLKTQNQKKDRIQEELKQRQERIMNKMDNQNSLMKKHKLIKKLYDRNFKVFNKQNQQGQNLRASKSRKRTYQEVTNKNLAITNINNSNFLSNLIYDAKIFVIADEGNINKKNENKIILNKFQSDHQVELFVPFKKMNQDIKEIKQGKLKQEDSLKMQIQNQDLLNQSQDSNNQYFQIANGIYSLMDLLQLLSLNDLSQE